VEVVSERLDALARDVSRGVGLAVAAHFLAGPNLRWEVYDYADAPNGTLGALRTLDRIAAVAEEIHARGEVWVSDQVVPPTNRDEGDLAVYGFAFSIDAGGTRTEGGAKVVIDCETRMSRVPWNFGGGPLIVRPR